MNFSINPVNQKISASKRCACWYWCCCMQFSGKGLWGLYH